MFEIPLFFASAWLSRTFSGTSMMLMGMGCYCTRVLYYTTIPDSHAWRVLLVEPLHGVTFGLIQMASVAEMARLAPGHLQATGQSFLSVARTVGTLIGSLGGGYVMQTHGPAVAYRAAAGVVACAAVVYGATAALCKRRDAASDGGE
jgi:predicted MFS family arabinose efflux permease